MNKIILFALIICMLNTAAYILIQDKNMINLSFPELISEPWRLITFQFSHTGVTHLIGNTLTFLAVGIMAHELDVDLMIFLTAYFAAIFAAVPMIFIFQNATFAGNSTGIYGTLAIILYKAKPYISEKISMLLVSLTIFYQSFMKFSIVKSDILHFIGLLAGKSTKNLAKRKNILRGVKN